MTDCRNDSFISLPDPDSAFRRYEDMLFMPHHVSSSHPHMSMHDRAAQFAPFEALGELENNSGDD